MMKTVVFEGEKYIGEVEIINVNRNNNNNGILERIKEKGIKISKYTKGSERCTPLSVLHTITRTCNGVCFKIMESSSSNNKFHQPDSQLFALYTTCLRDNKTAVMPLGEQEIHLVAIRSRRMDSGTPCFWGFSVIPGLYESCLGMLNLRCLGIVFDLDETLIVANTMRSFEDRIEALQRKISVETDHQRIECMIEEVKRYQEDKAMLKQYAETDQVVDNGKVHKCEAEVIPALSDDHQTIVRPLIRLQDKNIVLTRINPQIRDTSVLVRLRPAWEDLRSYLTARGRKRFEVYVCTMAERDYALEMWRLLDPDSNLISGREILERIVCVKSGSKKSLFNVFHGGICDPKMALVIDDRLKVWDEKDQPRVHVVPAFAPYYAPQAEANNTIPVLCMARNVACNVRGGFFKEFDDCFLQRISEVSFEDDPNDILLPPDVSNFLVSEDEGTGCNGNKESIGFDGMADAEVERRLKGTAFSSSSTPLSCAISTTASFESRLISSLASTAANSPMTIPQPTPQASFPPFHTNLFQQAGPLSRSLGNISQDLGLHSSSAREEGEVPESDLDPDIRRRLLILQHGQDIREKLSGEPSYQVRPAVHAPVAGPGPIPAPIAGPVTVPTPTSVTVPGIVPGPGAVSGLGPHHVPVPGQSPVSVSRVQRGSWFPVEDHLNLGPMSRLPPKDFPMDPDGMHVEKHRPLPPFPRKVENSVWSDRPFSEKQRLSREAPRRDDRLRPNYSFPRHHSLQGDEITLSRSASSKKDFEVEPEQRSSFAESPSVALNDIATRCGAKVEFKPGLVATPELKFSMEVYFVGEKIGDGTGTTRREAQHRAAEAAMMNLADRYLTHIKSETSTPQSDTSRGQSPSDMGLVSDAISHGDQTIRKEETIPSSEVTGPDANHVDDSRNSMSSVSALKVLCLQEDLDINVKGQSLSSTNPVLREDVLAEVVEGMTSKRLAPEYPQVLEHMPSLKCPRNASPVP